jgi:hypothetical protein
MVKMTFNFDEETIAHLKTAAQRLSKTKTDIVREGIEEVYKKSDKLSDEERERMLRVLEEYSRTPKVGTRAEAEREIREIRESRRRGWRPGAR